ncbi:MAG TPA: hypothetical protein EYO61_06715 [Campylobacterales bacterium]|nr:hypothetical protein [Campylobacterales bacterium]
MFYVKKGVNMLLFRYLAIFWVLASLLFSAPIDEKRVLVSKIGANKYKMRLYFNYENPYNTQATLVGRNAQYDVNIPIPDKFDVLHMSLKMKYIPSLLLQHTRSVIAVHANGHIARQFRLNQSKFKDSGVTTITSDIPTNFLLDYNKIGVKIIQHYASGPSEDTSVPELWTQLDLHHSYVEIVFKLKEFKEKLSSISKFVLDPKEVFKETLNFVFPKYPKDGDFFNYGFFAHFAGRTLKFRDIDFSVSTKIDDRRNNIIIMPRKDLKKVFEKYDIKDLDKKISGNINVIQNPHRPEKGFIVITGKDEKEIKNALFRLNSDLFLLDEQNIKVVSIETPPPAQPYSAPGYILPGSKVYFSELGYKTKTFSGEQPENLFLNFKMYPTVDYNDNDMIQVVIKTINSKILRNDSAINVYINNNFAYQYRISTNEKNDIYNAGSDQQFELENRNSIPSILLNKGRNSLKMDITMFPIGGPALVRFNNKILKLIIRDDSYLVFPEAQTEIEYPNLQYVKDLAFPFSIYPDLQNTGILITDFDSRTIASAMYVAFFLGKLVDYPAYYLTITPDINKMLKKDIISVGKQVERFALLYQNAPLKFTKDGLVKEISLGKKYIEVNGKKVEKSFASAKIVENVNLNHYLIVQMYQSPFDEKRVILEISANNPETLYKGIKNGFTPVHMGTFQGDTWLYNVDTNKSRSFRLQDSYTLHQLIEGDNMYGEDDFIEE